MAVNLGPIPVGPDPFRIRPLFEDETPDPIDPIGTTPTPPGLPIDPPPEIDPITGEPVVPPVVIDPVTGEPKNPSPNPPVGGGLPPIPGGGAGAVPAAGVPAAGGAAAGGGGLSAGDYLKLAGLLGGAFNSGGGGGGGSSAFNGINNPLINMLAESGLLGLLLSGGKTDPRGLNNELANISQSTQGAQTDLQGQLARLGIQNSGVGQALGQARGVSGANSRSNAIARENAATEKRKRGDLELFSLLVHGPNLQNQKLQNQQGQFNDIQDQEQQAAMMGALIEIGKMFTDDE